VCAVLSFFLYREIFSSKHVRLFWYVLLAVLTMTVMYALNPNNRVYSYHGFMHAGIVYQALNGNIPPLNPLLGGNPLLYPWGYHLLAAGISKMANLSPAYSFAVINVASAVLVMVLAYKISRTLVSSRSHNLFSALLTLTGATVFNLQMIDLIIQYAHINIEDLAIPYFIKFTNVNAAPLGIVFYLLFLFSYIKMSQSGKYTLYYGALLFLSVSGCGFFYPLMFPGILVCTATLFVAEIILMSTNSQDSKYKIFATKMIVIVVAVLFVLPYLNSLTGSDVTGKTEILSLTYVKRNALSCFVIALPVIALILINFSTLKKTLNKYPTIVLLASAFANMLAYVVFHLHANNELKLFILSMASLGILGGISLFSLTKWPKKQLAALILIPFLIPAISVLWMNVNEYADCPVTYQEDGINILNTDAEKNELYQWIRSNTAQDAIFMDLDLDIPVFAQRQLFIGKDTKHNGKILVQLGYGITMKELLGPQSGYAPQLLNQRNELIDRLYDTKQELPLTELHDTSARVGKIYIIAKSREMQERFASPDFELVFMTSNRQFGIYSPVSAHRFTNNRTLWSHKKISLSFLNS